MYRIKPNKSKTSRYLKAYLPFWKKEVGFYGNFGHGDLGDDANFGVARDLLKINLLPISKRCYAFNPGILKGLLIGGRAVLRWESPYIPRRLLKKDKWGFPVILFSAGINCDFSTDYSEEAKKKIASLCSKCTYLSVRDELSKRFLSDIGFSKVNILPDLELALKEKYKECSFKKKGFTVGIVLTPHSEFTSSTFEKIADNFVEFTNYLTDQGHNVLFLPFEGDIGGDPKERVLIEGIVGRIRNKEKVRIVQGGLEPGELLFIMKKYCDLMVCMRLHSVVLAVNAGLPFFCISYNLMHRGFLEMIDSFDLELPLSDGFSLQLMEEKFNYVRKDYNNIQKRIEIKKDYLLNLMQKEIETIKELLK
jgi:polysaccharide pyruvyl transferase WcaK-like protein